MKFHSHPASVHASEGWRPAAPSIGRLHNLPTVLWVTSAFTKSCTFLLSFACLYYTLMFRPAPSIKMWRAAIVVTDLLQPVSPAQSI